MFLDLLFPKHCLNCNKIGTYICEACIPTLQRHNQICIVCRKPSPWGATHTYCQSYSHISNLIIACIYKDTIRQAIHKIKYKFAYDIIEELCTKTLQSEKIKEFLYQKQIDFVTDIPSHSFKENYRGFNLPAYIAKWLSKHYQIEYKEILHKQRATTAQASLHRKDRLFNVEGSLEINMSINLKGKKILLIDDVLTTGSTLEEGAKIINQQHTAQVVALALASSK